MSRRCTICNHPERERIDSLLIQGVTIRDIAGRSNLTKSSVERHRTHLNTKLARAKEAREVAHADNLLDQVRDLQSRSLNILSKAEEAEDWRAAISAIREARGCLELLGKLAGELKEGQTVNVIVSPEWIEIRTVILEALEPYHEAMLSVSKAIGRLTNGSPST